MTETQIDEVMGLVCSYGLLCADGDTDECDLSFVRMEIEAKLREFQNSTLERAAVVAATEPRSFDPKAADPQTRIAAKIRALKAPPCEQPS